MVIDDFIKRAGAGFEKALRDAYDMGVNVGGEAMRDNIMRAAKDITGVPSPDNIIHAKAISLEYSGENKGDSSEKPKGKRAPKGLTEEVMKRVMTLSPRLTVEEIQRRAFEIDPRIMPKTVYNELRRKPIYLSGGDGRWSIKTQEHAQEQGEADV